MRVAVAVMTMAPQHARAAHALYGQAQAALRFEAREVQSHVDYPGPEVVRGLPGGDPAPRVSGQSGDKPRAGAAARASAQELRAAGQQLRAEATRLLSEYRKIGTEHMEAMRREIEGLARVLRASDSPPERALLLFKSALQPLIAEAPGEAEPVMEQIVRWFIESYYAA